MQIYARYVHRLNLQTGLSFWYGSIFIHFNTASSEKLYIVRWWWSFKIIQGNRKWY